VNLALILINVLNVKLLKITVRFVIRGTILRMECVQFAHKLVIVLSVQKMLRFALYVKLTTILIIAYVNLAQLLVSVKVVLNLHNSVPFVKIIIIQIKPVFVKLAILYHIVHNVLQVLKNALYVMQAITLKVEYVLNVLHLLNV